MPRTCEEGKGPGTRPMDHTGKRMRGERDVEERARHDEEDLVVVMSNRSKSLRLISTKSPKTRAMKGESPITVKKTSSLKSQKMKKWKQFPLLLMEQKKN